MSTSSDLDAIATALVKAAQTARERAGERAVKIVEEVVKADIGGDMALSNFYRGRPARLRVEADTDGDQAVVRFTPPGPWTFYERGSYKAMGGWWIPRKKTVKRVRGKLRVVGGVRLPDGGVRPFVRHRRGVRGWQGYSRARDRMAREVPEVIVEELAKVAR